MSEKMYLYPKWLRIWHWLNALLFLILIITGISMQYSNADFELINFKVAVYTHNISGVIVTAIYFIFLAVNIFGENSIHYKLEKKGLIDRLRKQFEYYTKGIFKDEKAPFPMSEKNKFNPLQKVTYVAVMYILMPLSIITGWAILFPETTINRVFGTSGLFLTDVFHSILGFLMSMFMIVHVYFATISKKPMANFKAMMTGWHEHD